MTLRRCRDNVPRMSRECKKSARLVVTVHWHVVGPGGPLELVGDFLLERTAGPGLRALA